MIGGSLGRAKIKEVFLCIRTKYCTVKSAVGNLNSLLLNRNSTHKKGSPTNPAGAPNVARRARPRWVTAAFSQNARCIRRSVLPVGKRPHSPSNRVETDRFTAETAINRSHAETTGKWTKKLPLITGSFFMTYISHLWSIKLDNTPSSL